MQTYFTQLMAKMEKELVTISSSESPVKGYDKCAETVHRYIEEIKSWLCKHPFANKESEILFYKKIAPEFYSKYILYVKLYNTELFRIAEDNGKFLDFIAGEIEYVNNFIHDNGSLFRYYLSGRDNDDAMIFVSESSRKKMSIFSITRDANYCSASFRLGEILAYHQYRKILLSEQLEKDPERAAQSSEKPTLVKKWSTSKAEAVELLVCLFEAQVIHVNGQPATLAQLKEDFEHEYNFPLGEVSVTDWQNRIRKKEDAPFMNKLINIYISRKDRLLGC